MDADQWARLPPEQHVDAAIASLRMLWLLCGAEYDVTTLTAAVGSARPAVSQHLAKLRLTGLVTQRRDGRRAVYRATGGHVRRMLDEALQSAHHHVAGLPEHD